MTVFVVMVAVCAVTLLTVVFVQRTEERESDQLLVLLCETGRKNLDYYFDSIQKSVGKVALYAESDLEGLSEEQLTRHMDHVGAYFDEMAHKTNGVFTYYYRLDPEVSDSVKGFWYTWQEDEGFVEHEVTDISLYDTSDTSSLVWFTVPKFAGEAVWLPPYITDNLGARVMSYNVPIFFRGRFVGVVGIEFDYSTMAELVDSIRIHTNGYAFVNDSAGNLIYHPYIDVSVLTEESKPKAPVGLVGEENLLRYTFEGVEKELAWLPLVNGMRLNVSVPVSETKGDWERLVINILICALEVMIAAVVFVMFYARRITSPLEQLTRAAEQVDQGNYEIELTYDRDDEVGRLTNTFKRLVSHVREHITDLNRKVYVDPLTSVKNKGAYADCVEALQHRMDRSKTSLRFAVGVFDCDDLKLINDRYGHEDGDTYLKCASRLICSIFKKSPVFRIGGDEFSVILEDDDYNNREELIARFRAEMEQISRERKRMSEQVHVSMGIAAYDPAVDSTVMDVVNRADKLMYENKRERKSRQRES